jgi:hypothetical protein
VEGVFSEVGEGLYPPRLLFGSMGMLAC